MYQYNRKRAEELIAEIFEGEYEATEDRESKNYVFVSYKHKLYDADDDRGKRIGPGPLVFYKNTGEYKISGSGDFIQGTFGNEMDEAYGDNENVSTDILPETPEIIVGIVRRGYVNERDAHLLLYYINMDYPDIENALVPFRRDMTTFEYFLFENNNPEYIRAVTALWDSLGFKYHWDNSELYLHRIRN